MWRARNSAAVCPSSNVHFAINPSVSYALQERTCLVERQPRESRLQRAWIAVPKVTEEIRFDVPFREELLITPETWFAGGKEFLVHLGVIEAGHGPAIETERPRGHDQVRALQARIPLRGDLHQLRIALKQLRHAGIGREQLRQLLVELQVVGDDDGGGSGHRLLDVEWRQRRAEPLLGFS